MYKGDFDICKYFFIAQLWCAVELFLFERLGCMETYVSQLL